MNNIDAFRIIESDEVYKFRNNLQIAIKELQDQGLQVEVKYSTVQRGQYGVGYSALLLGRIK